MNIGGEMQIDKDAALAIDRRRPGRPENVHPELLPLLRGEFREDLPDGDGDVEPSAPPRELVRGTTLMVALVMLGVFLRFAV